MVLAFYDYANVPTAKGITQALRRARVVPITYQPGDPMYLAPPEPWDAAMANRTFKAEVQRLVVEALPRLLEPDTPATLVLDWTGPDCVAWTWRADGSIERSIWAREQVR